MKMTPKNKLKVYNVIRWFFDSHTTGETYVDRQSTWHTYEDALKAAKRNLLDEWDRDFFDEYEETNDGSGEMAGSDGFEIYALCPEGEEMRVYIEEAYVEDLSNDIVVAENRENHRTNVYVIESERQKHQNDEIIKDGLISDSAYPTVAIANKAAQDYLQEVFNKQKSAAESAKDLILSEKNAQSDSLLYEGTLYHNNETLYATTVRVKALKM